MNTIFHQTENAVFEFSENDIEDHIKLLTKEHNIEEPSKSVVVLDLIATGKGSVTCKVCGKKYRTNELKETAIGFGRSPFDVNIKQKGGARSLFKRKQKLPAMFGGKGYECPEGHELVALITWRT
jgi:hypothetical protein